MAPPCELQPPHNPLICMDPVHSEIRFNARVASMQPSATLAMTARSKQRKREGFPVIGLSAGEPDFDTPEIIADAAYRAIREGFTHYTDNSGMLELREAIVLKLANENGLIYEPDQILCSNGAKQSIAQVISVLCGPGDEVLIPAPYWVSYPEMVRFAGAIPVSLPTSVHNGYRIDAEQLRDAITERTRLLILCSPSNPTGMLYEPHQLVRMAEVLEKYPDVRIVSDEIYEKIVYDGDHVSFASLPGMMEQTITVNGFSKAYAMTGWRLGFMAAERPIVKAAAKLQSQFTSAPSSISQKAGIAALKMSSEPIDRMVAAFRERRDFVLEELRGIDGIRCPRPEGAFYVFPDVSHYLGRTSRTGVTVNSSEELCFYILDSFNVALVPGQAFGGPYGLRISYAASMEDLKEAMERLRGAFASFD